MATFDRVAAAIGKGDSAIAAETGIERTMIRRYRQGVACPSARSARRLEEWATAHARELRRAGIKLATARVIEW